MANGNMNSAVMILFALELKATVLEISLIAASGAYVSILSRIGLGLLSDRLGRKPILMVGLTSGSVASLLCSLSYTPLLLIVANIFEGLRWSAYFSNGLALVADVSSDSERARSITAFTLASSAGLLLGPAFATVALLFISIRQLFYISTAISLAVVIAAQRFMPAPPVQKYEAGVRGSLRSVFKKRTILLAGWLISLYFFVELAVSTFVPVFATTVIGLSESQVTILSTLRAMMMTFVRFFVTRLERRFGRRRLLLITSLGFLASSPLIGLSGSFLQIAVLSLVFGAAQGASFPLMILAINESTDPSERGVANALCLAIGDLAGALSPLAMGAVVETLGITPMFALTSVPVLLLIISEVRLPAGPLSEGSSGEELA
jgi:MFS family permease